MDQLWQRARASQETRSNTAPQPWQHKARTTTSTTRAPDELSSTPTKTMEYRALVLWRRANSSQDQGQARLMGLASALLVLRGGLHARLGLQLGLLPAVPRLQAQILLQPIHHLPPQSDTISTNYAHRGRIGRVRPPAGREESKNGQQGWVHGRCVRAQLLWHSGASPGRGGAVMLLSYTLTGCCSPEPAAGGDRRKLAGRGLCGEKACSACQECCLLGVVQEAADGRRSGGQLEAFGLCSWLDIGTKALGLEHAPARDGQAGRASNCSWLGVTMLMALRLCQQCSTRTHAVPLPQAPTIGQRSPPTAAAPQPGRRSRPPPP